MRSSLRSLPTQYHPRRPGSNYRCYRYAQDHTRLQRFGRSLMGRIVILHHSMGAYGPHRCPFQHSSLYMSMTKNMRMSTARFITIKSLYLVLIVIFEVGSVIFSGESLDSSFRTLIMMHSFSCALNAYRRLLAGVGAAEIIVQLGK